MFGNSRSLIATHARTNSGCVAADLDSIERFGIELTLDFGHVVNADGK
jgi:hypothetical protein